MAVLVTGGAGYIGSHMTYALCDRNERVVVLDDLSTGVRSLVDHRAHFVQGKADDRKLVSALIKDHQVDSVIHFAGSIVIPESVQRPLRYYANNTVVSHALLNTCVETSVKYFVFSSTAAVYGLSGPQMVTENTPLHPINPYGRSKLITEWILEDTARATDIRYMALRYFNVAGADPRGRTGQSTPKATHLIKRACQVALARAPHLEVFGSDYPTPDGTGVRDYIHVSDLVAVHELALDALRQGGASAVYNCGYGRGFSVRQIAQSVERVAGHAIATVDRPRRAGDPAVLIADPTQAKRVLGWQPKYDDLDLIVSTALSWERQLV